MKITEVARALAVRLEYGCLGTDDMIQAIMAVTSVQSHPHFHLLEQKDHRKYFITHTIARMAMDAQYRNEAAWPAFQRVIEYHLEEESPVVIGGWALLPDRVAQLDHPQVRSFWLVADEEFFQNRIQREQSFFDLSPMEGVFARKFAARSVQINNDLRRAVDKLGLPMLEITSETDFNAIVERIYRFWTT